MQHNRYLESFVFVLFAPVAIAAAPDVRLELVADGFDRPVLVTHAGDGSGRVFVVEQTGAIQVIHGGAVQATTFLDISAKLVNGGERGLLGLAFHPDYANNGFFYVYYTRTGDGASIVARYSVSAADPDVADVNSESIVLGPVGQPEGNHNGGHIAFGHDGYLYIGLGDGGGGGDQHGSIGNGQNTFTLLGSILRIDVDGGSPYAVPPDNPFADSPTSGEVEIYGWGLRNPWRFSFDRATGRLFCGDVGQNRIEEIDIIEIGGNYGWRRMEGSDCFNPSSGCQTGNLLLPIHEYGHSAGRCSVTGGYVYRGKASPTLDGLYFYGDYCTGEIWALEEVTTGTWTNTLALDTPYRISSFGEDEDGEIYVCDLNGGGVYILVGPPDPSAVRHWARY